MASAAPDRIHILGASGSGTTTLGAAIAQAHGHVHLDTDDYYWEPTDPPFQITREPAARVAMLGAALDAHPRWVLTGSLCGWGDAFVPRFDLVIFLLVPTDVRLARLRERERRRFGADSLAPSGAMHTIHEAFMGWAAGYDDGGEDMRSRRQHERWLSALPCSLIRLEEPGEVAEQMARLTHRLARARRHRSAGGATNVVTSTMTTTAANVDADRTG